MALDSKNIKILLAEDAVAIRKMEIKILRSIGFENVIEVNDGNEAIEILKTVNDIDLVISDWNMPNLGGYELLLWVKGSDNYKKCPFVMATAQADRDQSQKATTAGCNAFLPKPFTENELQEVIDIVFGVVAEGATEDTVEIGAQRLASGKVRLRVAHIQITDHIILGVLNDWIKQGDVTPKHFELETKCMSSWNPVERNLESGEVDAAFILAPIAMDLFHHGVPIKMVMLAHRNGSIFVRNKLGDYKPPYNKFYQNKSVLIPHKMSVHHMLTHMFFNTIDMKASLEKGDDVDINLEVVAPIDMPSFMQSSTEAAGFMVAEPIGARSIATGISTKQFLSSELWPNHPCCVVAVRNDFSEQYSEAVQEFVELLMKAGEYVAQESTMAAFAAVRFLDPDKKLGLKVPVLKAVLTDPLGIRTDNLFPVKKDLDQMQQYMVNNMAVGNLIDIDSFVDSRYAEKIGKGFDLNTHFADFQTSVDATITLLEVRN